MSVDLFFLFKKINKILEKCEKLFKEINKQKEIKQ